MPRYRLTVEYDGGPFVGWQRQANGPSVQEALEEAVFRFCGERTTVHGAGRTDAGVHALGQVAHVELQRVAVAATLRDAINFHLKPAPIAVLEAAPAADDFHARFSARAREYVYRILDRPSPPTIDRDRVWWLPHPLDVDAMARAAKVLVGHHDFTSFRSTLCQAETPLKTLDRLDVRREGAEIRVTARARSFLHNPMRVLTGTLKLVGEGRWRTADVERALAARDRTRAGQTAPACGLYLLSVEYDEPADAAQEDMVPADIHPGG